MMHFNFIYLFTNQIIVKLISYYYYKILTLYRVENTDLKK